MATTESPTRTPIELVRITASYFSEKGVESPRLEAEVLLAHVLGMERIGLYLSFDKPLSEEEVRRFRSLVRDRAKGVPTAYLTGKREFWSLPFTVAPGVLIPRPDTELLVEQAVKIGKPDAEILEIGVGSGAVIISALTEKPGWRGVGVDISGEALAQTAGNARALKVADRLELFEGDLYAPLGERKFDLIISNPPYIPAGEIDTLAVEVSRHEPRLALDGGPDGLETIRRLMKGAPSRLVPGGTLLMEFGLGQEGRILEIVAGTEGLARWEILPDLTGRPRAVKAVAA